MTGNGKTTIKLLRPDEVWHPHIGAPPGNRNAVGDGTSLAALARRIRGLKARLRALQEEIGDD